MHVNEYLPPRARVAFKWFALCCLFAQLPALHAAEKKTKPRAPLYVDLIDMTGPQFGPAVRGLDDRRRGPIFAAAMREATRAGELPPVTFVNDDLTRLAGVNYRNEKTKVPAGEEVVRVFITRWSETQIGGAVNTDVHCRVFAEVHRDANRVARLGPFFGSVPLRTYLNPDDRQFYADFGAAARAAVREMAGSLSSKKALATR